MRCCSGINSADQTQETYQVSYYAYVRDHASFTPPTRQHELDHTYDTDHLPWNIYSSSSSWGQNRWSVRRNLNIDVPYLLFSIRLVWWDTSVWEILHLLPLPIPNRARSYNNCYDFGLPFFNSILKSIHNIYRGKSQGDIIQAMKIVALGGISTRQRKYQFTCKAAISGAAAVWMILQQYTTVVRR